MFVEMQNKRPQSRELHQRPQDRGGREERVPGAGEGLGLAARRGAQGSVQQWDADRYCTTLFQRLIRPVPAVPL